MDEAKLSRYLRDLEEKSKEYASAKAQQVKLEHFRNARRAQLMMQFQKDNPKASVALSETWALAHEDYATVIEGYAAATEQAIKLDWEMRIAQHRLELLRTLEATRREEMRNLGG